jgi:hypothetical protein
MTCIIPIRFDSTCRAAIHISVVDLHTDYDSTVTQGVWGNRASIFANDEIPEWTPGGVVNLLEAVAPKRRDKPEIQAR